MQFTLPQPHQLLRRIRVQSLSTGQEISTGTYHGVRNLLLVLLPDFQHPLVSVVRELAAQLEPSETVAMLVVARSTVPPPNLPAMQGLVLGCEPSGELHQRLGALNPSGDPSWALYLTDRWGEIFACWRSLERPEPPSAAEVVSWIAFVNYQCEECTASRWLLDQALGDDS